MSVRPRPWLLYVPLIVSGIIFAGYGVLWNMGAGEMRQSIKAWADDQRAEGLDVSYARITTEGFPFFLRGAVDNVVISDESIWRWSAPALHIDANPSALDRLILSARQPHQIEIAGLGVWRIQAPDGRASIARDKARAWIVDVESGRADLEGVENNEQLSVERFLLTISPAESDDETIEASLSVAGVGVVREETSIDLSRLEAMAALKAAPFVEKGAQEWRAAGGVFELRHFLIETGDGRLVLSGELTVDPEGYPAGVLNVEATNPAALALTLADAGVISDADAARAGAALTLAAIAGGGTARAPLILEKGEATIAGVKVATIARIPWPQP